MAGEFVKLKLKTEDDEISAFYEMLQWLFTSLYTKPTIVKISLPSQKAKNLKV